MRRLHPIPARDPLRVLVHARTPARAAELERRVAALGRGVLGPLCDAALAREAAAALAPDVCLIELPLDGAPVLLVTTELADRRESRGLSVRLAEPFGDEELDAAIELAFDRACELRTIERQARAPREVMRDVDALVRAKAVLGARLGMSERHASRRLVAAARNRGERLADTARRVWDRRGSIGTRADTGVAA